MKSKSPLSLVDLCSYDVIDFLHNFPRRFPPCFVQISFHSFIFLWIVLFLATCIISYHLILCHIIYHIISVIQYHIKSTYKITMLSNHTISYHLYHISCRIISYPSYHAIHRTMSYHFKPYHISHIIIMRFHLLSLIFWD